MSPQNMSHFAAGVFGKHLEYGEWPLSDLDRDARVINTTYFVFGGVFGLILVLLMAMFLIVLCCVSLPISDLSARRRLYKFYDFRDVRDPSTSIMSHLVFYSQRPLVKEMVLLLTLLAFVLHLVMKLPLSFAFSVWIIYDILAAAHALYLHRQRAIQQARRRQNPTRRSWKRALKSNLYFVLAYSLSMGFPIATATKLLLSLWVHGHVTFAKCFLPYTCGILLVGLISLIYTIYAILNLCRKQMQGEHYSCMKVVGGISAMILALLWSFGLATMTECMDEKFLLRWTKLHCENFVTISPAVLAPFTVPLLIGLLTITWICVTRGMIWRFLPEMFNLLLGTMALITMSYHVDLTPRLKEYYQLHIVATFMLGAAICCTFIYNLILVRRIILERRNGINLIPEQRERMTEEIKNSLIFRVLNKSTKDSNSPLPDFFTNSLRRYIRRQGLVDMCAICWEKYDNRSQTDNPEPVLALTKKCGHYYHFECLSRWLHMRNKCPLCMHSLQIAQDVKAVTLSEVRAVLPKQVLRQESSECDSDDEDIEVQKQKPDLRSRPRILDASHLLNQQKPMTSQTASSTSQQENQNRTPRRSTSREEIREQRRLSIATLSRMRANNKDLKMCYVCRTSYTGAEEDIFVGVIKSCGHYFHTICIDEFLGEHNYCPECQAVENSEHTPTTSLTSLRRCDLYFGNLDVIRSARGLQTLNSPRIEFTWDSEVSQL